MANAFEVRIDRRAALRRGVLLIAGAVAAPAIGALAACTVAGPRPIAYGHDECAYCRMVISDRRFGAALVTAKGRTVVFDSVECLASWYDLSRDERGRDVARSLWVSDYNRPGHLLDASRARYLRVVGPASPMGKGLIAIASDADARRVPGAGETSGWDVVVATVRREGLQRGDTGETVPATGGESDAARD
jgi:copper chaperone NosL